jgi:hypothetical protein
MSGFNICPDCRSHGTTNTGEFTTLDCEFCRFWRVVVKITAESSVVGLLNIKPTLEPKCCSWCESEEGIFILDVCYVTGSSSGGYICTRICADCTVAKVTVHAKNNVIFASKDETMTFICGPVYDVSG